MHLTLEDIWKLTKQLDYLKFSRGPQVERQNFYNGDGAKRALYYTGFYDITHEYHYELAEKVW